MHFAAISERLGVQVTINAWTDGVVDDGATAIENEVLILSMCLTGLRVIYGIKRHQSCPVGITDILRHGKGEGEDTVAYTIRTAVDRLRTVLEGISLFCIALFIHPADNCLFRIPYGGGDDTTKGTINCLVVDHMPPHLCDAACRELDGRLGRRLLSIDIVDHYFLCRCSQHQSGVSQKRVLQFIRRQVISHFHQLALNHTRCLPYSVPHAIGRT